MAEIPNLSTINNYGNQTKFFVLENLPSNPVELTSGRLYFNTTDKQVMVFDGTSVKPMINVDLTINPDSVNYLSIDSQYRLSIKSLAISDVTVNTTSTDIADFIANFYILGTEFQEGDTIVFTAFVGGRKTYIHNGGTAGDETDFTILADELTASEVRAMFSNINPITYNSSTGEIGLLANITMFEFDMTSGLQLKGGGIDETKLATAVQTKLNNSKAFTVGTGSQSSFTLTHNLNSTDVSVYAYKISDGTTITAGVQRTSVNQITITVTPPPNTNDLRVVVTKSNIAI